MTSLAPAGVRPDESTLLAAQIRSRSGELVAVVSLVLLTLVIAGLTWRTWGDLGRDTGYDSVAAGLVAHGRLPFVDFTYYYGLLTPLLGGLFALVAGAGFDSTIAFGLVLATGILIATYVLARTQAGRTGAFVATVLVAPVAFAPTNLSYVVAHSASAPLAILIALAFLIAVHVQAERPSNRGLVLVGVTLGASALTRPEFALAVFAAAALWLVLRRSAAHDVALVVTPAVLMPLVAYAPFAAAIGVHRLLFDNLLPAHVLAGGPNHVLRLHAPLTVHSFVELTARLALYATGIVCLLVLGRRLSRSQGRRPRSDLVIPAMGVAAGVLAVIVRPETARYYLEFAYGWIPAGALIAVAVLSVRARRTQTWTARDQAALACSVVLAVLAVKTYATFFILSTPAQYAVYAFPFAAVLLVRLHLFELGSAQGVVTLGAAWLAFLAVVGIGLTVTDARAETGLVRGPGGAIAVPPGETHAYSEALSWIERTTRAGEPILLAPQMTLLYTLADRSDPLPELALSPGALPDVSAQRKAVARLNAEHVRLAVIDERPYTEFGQTTFGASFDSLVGAWVRTHFTRVATLATSGRNSHPLTVWLRTAS